MSAHVNAFNITTGAATSTVVITGCGFAPQAVIFWWSGVTASTETGEQADCLPGFGFATDTGGHGAIAGFNDDPAGTSATDSSHRTDACILQQGDGAMVGWADVQSWDSDGFTIEILDALTVDMRICFMAIGGLNNYDIGILTGPSGTGSQSITSHSFQADAAIFASAGIAADAPSTTVDLNMSVGFATGPSNEFVVAMGANDAVGTSVAKSYAYTGECIALMDGGSADVGTRAEFTQFTSTGFDLNWLEVGISSVRVLYLLMNTGGNATVGVMENIPKADTSTTFGPSGFSFQPEGILTLSSEGTANTQNTVIAHATCSFGGASGASNRQTTALSLRDASATARSGRAYLPAQLGVNTFTEGAIDGSFDLVSLDSGGFTCVCDNDFSDFGSNEFDFGYLAFRAPANQSFMTLLGVG